MRIPLVTCDTLECGLHALRSGTACGRTANIHAMYRADGFLAQLGEELRPHPKLDGNRKWPLGKEYAGYSGGFTVQQYVYALPCCIARPV